jgi:ATP-binding cassette subfamily B multidrug efflux pump
VLQETVLFTGTVRDNIRYACPDATDEQVEAAARVAQAHDFVSSFPEGYDTLVGQRGVNLSGGQKQRLAIARALICEPSILIMDDCTSAVDATTEAAIVDALSGLAGSGHPAGHHPPRRKHPRRRPHPRARSRRARR